MPLFVVAIKLSERWHTYEAKLNFDKIVQLICMQIKLISAFKMTGILEYLKTMV